MPHSQIRIRTYLHPIDFAQPHESLTSRISLPSPDYSLTPQEKAQKWQKVIAKLPKTSANLPDEALHRDTMYED